MIYISTSCLKNTDLADALNILCKNGFRNIELSGGFRYSSDLEEKIMEFKAKYNLNYICHNYFPPPKEPFVLNLASLDDNIYRRSLRHLQKAMTLAKKLGSGKFGFHTGFFIDIEPGEIGKKINYRKPFDRDKCINRFCKGFDILKRQTPDLELYIENNVISNLNLKTFNGVNPLMMASFEDYTEIKKIMDFKLLLDIGHLKVSSHSLGLDFEDELEKMINVSDYLHFSDNDGLTDQHRPLLISDNLLKKLRTDNTNERTIVIEVHGDIKNIKELYKMAEESLK